MDLRALSKDLSVSPQLDPADMRALAAEGFRTVIDNRPDAEVGADHASDRMRAAAEAAGLEFRYLPFSPAMGVTPDLVSGFSEALDLPGPIVAYCRSGTRSATLWALAHRGRLSADEVIAAGAAAGYDLSSVARHLG